MQLEDYFDFLGIDDIRVKGTRLNINVIIADYLDGYLPEQIVHNYRESVNLEQVFATLAYYLHNKTAMDALLQRDQEATEARYQEYLQQERPEVVKRLLALREQQKQQPVAAP